MALAVATPRGTDVLCPKCGGEFIEGVKRCPDCGVDLVDALLEPQAESTGERQTDLGRRGLARTTPRPRPVSAALLLLIASWCVGLIFLLVSPPTANEQTATRIVVIVAEAAYAGLIAALAYRRRWAYVVYLVLAVLTLPYAWSGARRSFDLGPWRAANYVIGQAVVIAVVVLLLRRPAREWYGFGPKTAGGAGEWRLDPSGRHQHRYWDGTVWTDQVADDGQVDVDPLGDLPAEVPLTGASI